jgi:hypothetical protein
VRTITIGFSKPKNRFFPVISWIIRLYQGTEYSHAYLKFDSASLNRTLVYEAVGGGVRFVGSNLWKHKAEEVKQFQIQITDDQFIHIMQYCVDTAGVSYGSIQNVGVILATIFKMKNNPFKKGKNCSEVVAEILQMQGHIFTKSLDLITPKDIDLALSK